MHISENLIFMDLHKTGSSFVSQVLSKVVGGRSTEPHLQIRSSDEIYGKKVLGTIRNPWDWYLSLWAYGCDKRGDFYGRVIKSDSRFRGLGWRQDPYEAAINLFTKRSRQAERWKKTYQDVNDPTAFREWLGMVHNENFWFDYGEGYGRAPLNKFAGLYTYRYLKLYCCAKNRNNALLNISTYDQLVSFEKENCFIDFFITNENLNIDLLRALEKLEIMISKEDRDSIFSAKKVNTSSKKRGVSFYYDSETRNMIYEREKMIIDKFAYPKPRLANSS